MKYLYYIFTALIICLCSCSKLLDKSPLGIISEDVVYSDPVLAQAYVNDVYLDLSFLNRGSGGFVIDPTSDLTDEARQGRSWNLYYVTWKAGLLNENGGLLELWQYGTIRKINTFLEKINESTLPDDLKKRMIAEMRFARAITYFYMVKRYGGIPLITIAQSIDDPAEELFVPRNKEVDIYDFVLQEMDAIVNDLPSENTRIGFPTKYAALALKSRAALYAASIATWGQVHLDGLVGIPSTEAQRFWQASYNASKEIIESNAFSLYNKIPDNKSENFKKLFTDENNSEVIFSWQLTGVGVNSNYDIFQAPTQFVPGWGSNTAIYLEMVEEFENIDGSPGTFDWNLATSHPWALKEFFANKDPRFHATVYYEGSLWKGEAIENWGGIILPNGTKITSGSYEGRPAQGRSFTSDGYAGGAITGFNVAKYLDEDLDPIALERSKVDFIVFRLGEVLLNYAEAAFELEETDEALTAVNQIRQRAGIASLSDISRDKIRHERKVELAFEDQRYWDLRRWRTAVDAINRTFTGIYTFYDANSGKFRIEKNENAHGGVPAVFLEKHYYLPITPARITNNPNLAPENPGY